MANLEILIRSKKRRYVFGEPLQLTYQAINTSPQLTFVVADSEDWLFRNIDSAGALSLTLGELASAREMDYYAYRAPKLRTLAPGHSIHGRLRVGMPPDQIIVDSDGVSRAHEITLSGAVNVYLTVGYTEQEFRPQTADPLGEFIDVQQLATSNEITVEIASP